MKKLIAKILVTAMLFSIGAPCALALTTDTAGEKTLNVELGEYSTISSAQYSDSILKMAEGGKVVYDLYIPFNAASIEFKYTPKDGNSNMTLMFNDKSFTKELSGSSATVTIDPCIIKGQ